MVLQRSVNASAVARSHSPSLYAERSLLARLCFCSEAGPRGRPAAVTSTHDQILGRICCKESCSSSPGRWAPSSVDIQPAPVPLLDALGARIEDAEEELPWASLWVMVSRDQALLDASGSLKRGVCLSRALGAPRGEQGANPARQQRSPGPCGAWLLYRLSPRLRRRVGNRRSRAVEPAEKVAVELFSAGKSLEACPGFNSQLTG